ncbi:MAG: subtilase-type serine protease, partial [Humisphaera sp.]|nr:subtilase-type serine protease [Humisphaera sp.]
MKSLFVSRARRASERTTLLAAAAAIVALAAPRFATAAADFSSVWNGGIGSWNDPAQWTPALVPNNGAQTFDASISAGTANLASSVLLEKLNVTGGVIASPSATPFTITANDTFTWSGGQFENTNVVAGAGANLSGNPTSSMLGLTIPAGKLLTSSGGTFQITRSTINNNGIIQITGATTFNTSSGTTFFRGTINNAGAMNVNAATSLANVAFNNSGTISLAAPLTLNGGGTWTGGSITSPGGFALTFTGNSHVLDAASNIPGTMPLNIQGSVTFDFPMVRTAPTQFGGGTARFKKPVSFPAGGPALQVSAGAARFEAGATIDVPLTLVSSTIE